MRVWTTRVTGVLTALVLLVASAFAEETQTKVPNPPKEMTSIPAGSVLHMKLTSTLTSKTNKTGDPFTGQVSQPILVGGQRDSPQIQPSLWARFLRETLRANQGQSPDAADHR